MKTLNLKLWRILFILTLLFNTGCSSEKEGGESEENTPFVVTLNGKNYAGTTQRLFVPFEGVTYELNVKASANTTWTVVTENVIPNHFLDVNPTGSGRGESIIKIVAAKNENKENGHTGTVTITNSSNKAVLKFIFDQKEKALVFPEGTLSQKTEDFYKKESKFSIYHMAEGPNVAILYENKWGENPESDPKLPLDRKKAVEYAEDVYAWMIDEAGFANWTTSEAAKYKMLIFVHYSNEGGAVGYGKPNVGILEVKQPGIMNVNKYGIPGLLQHEIMHCFQYITHYDGSFNYGWSGPIYEMSSQWSLTRRWPDWPDLEYGHFKAFMENTHRAFMHEDNQYHSPYVLIFWEYKHPNMVSKLWKGNIEADGKDPVVTYKRLNNITQEEFNDEMFEGACRFVTWDIPHMKEANVKHIDKHQYKLKEISISKFQAHPETCPQNYGYNCIKLKTPDAGQTVTIDFKGNIGLNGYKIKNGVYKGWRYGFVALKENGERIYGEMNKEDSKRITFTIPEGGVKSLWFVVMGAPTTHWNPKPSSEKPDSENNWPYEFTVNGTILDTPKAV